MRQLRPFAWARYRGHCSRCRCSCRVRGNSIKAAWFEYTVGCKVLFFFLLHALSKRDDEWQAVSVFFPSTLYKSALGFHWHIQVLKIVGSHATVLFLTLSFGNTGVSISNIGVTLCKNNFAMVNLLTGALFLLTVKHGVHDSAFFRKQVIDNYIRSYQTCYFLLSCHCFL